MCNPANHCMANSKAAGNATSRACLESPATGFPLGQHPSPHMGSSFLFHIHTHRPFTMKSLLVSEFYTTAHFMVSVPLFNLFINVIVVYLIFANILLYEYSNFIHFTDRYFSCFQSLFRSQFLLQCFRCEEPNVVLANGGSDNTPQLFLSTELLLSLNI